MSGESDGGKGSRPRPYTISLDEYADNYDRMFYGVRVSGSGVILLYLIVDGVSVATKQLDFTTADGRSLLIPEETFGRALQIRVEGTGRIEQVVVEYQG